jgi:membrane associated rhomboid family serine protease
VISDHRRCCRLEKYGGLDRYKVVHRNQAWRLETSTWLHAGLIHLGANMISLIFVGVRLEQQFGFCKPPDHVHLAVTDDSV